MVKTPQQGQPFGLQRVLEPKGVLPQQAQRLDNDFSHLFDNEYLIDVSQLNIDAASFKQMEEACGGDAKKIGVMILQIVSARGKQQNPVTGSGGMLIGRVAAVGAGIRKPTFKVGDEIATLVSLTLTPLHLKTIKKVDASRHRVEVEGQAVLWDGAPMVALPPDFPLPVALALMDVAGAAPQAARLAKPGQTVLVLGAGGKSGVLVAAAVREQLGAGGLLLGIEASAVHRDRVLELGIYDAVFAVDARDALAAYQAVKQSTKNAGADVVFNCVSVPDAEMATILCTRRRGTAFFFSMATQFSRATLGAEGVGADIDLMMGNGFCENNGALTLDLVRRQPRLKEFFLRHYS